MQNTVLVTQPLPDQYLESLAEHAELDVLDAGESLSDPALGTRRSACYGLVCTLTDTIDLALLNEMDMLKFVSTVSVGVDHINVSALSRRGIAVGNTPGVLADATADTAFALLLASARRIAEGDRYIRDGKWTASNRWSPGFFLGKDVSGSTLGIVGLGPVGQAVARRAAGFGMTVVSWTPSGRKVPGVRSVALEELLATSDFVSVHVALANTTRNLIDGARIATMKPGAVLVDVAIDQGGCFETSKATTHADPIYEVDGVMHYCVANMPGAVARTSTIALGNATMPFLLALADKGWRQACTDDPHLLNGLNVHAGRLTYYAVGKALGIDVLSPALAIKA